MLQSKGERVRYKRMLGNIKKTIKMAEVELRMGIRKPPTSCSSWQRGKRNTHYQGTSPSEALGICLLALSTSQLQKLKLIE